MHNNPPPYQDPTRPGGAGIKPKIKSTTKSFTAEEAKTFAENHSFMNAVPTGKNEVVGVTFMTSKQASLFLHNTYIGVPDDDLVCVVELKGMRVVASPALIPPKKRVAQYRKTYAVLDAQSGNLLLENHSSPVIN